MPRMQFERGAHSAEWTDESSGRNRARLVFHDGNVYIETEGNHDGVVVYTAVRVSRAVFAERLKLVGGLL